MSQPTSTKPGKEQAAAYDISEECIRVLLPFIGVGIGGSVVSTSEMVNRLLNHGGVEPVVLAPAPGPATPLFEKPGVRLIFSEREDRRRDTTRLDTSHVLGKLKAIPRYLSMYQQARRILSELRPDVVHLNEDRLLLPWGLAARPTRTPVVWHVRQERPNTLLDPLRLRLSKHLVFVSNANRRRFESVRNLPPSSLIYNVVDTTRFHPATCPKTARSALGLDPERLTLTFLGNLVERKRAEWVLAAAADLQQRFALQVLIVGAPSGPPAYVERLKRIAGGAPDRDHIHFLGLRTDVADILRASDVVTLPSVHRGEAFPRAIIEAMATGVPVVATDVAGVREAVEDGETGLLVDAGDFDEYSRSLAKLLSNHQLRMSMGARAREVAIDRFAGKEIASTLATIYRSLVR